ncbi:MAG: hypothetical protein IKJ30_04915 [Bacilli bacterium]|nr:hypothetical protein [Bacilli bacterium]
MEKKSKLRGKDIKRMIENNDFSFLLELNEHKLASLCVKMKSNKIIGKLATLDFDKVESFISYLLEHYITSTYVIKDLFIELLNSNKEKTIEYLVNHSAPYSLLNLVDSNDYEKLSDMLIEYLEDKNFKSLPYSSILRESFVFTYAYMKKNPKEALDSYKIMSIDKMSDKQLEIIMGILDKGKYTELPRKYLKNEKVLRRYIESSSERKYILSLLDTTTYSSEEEKKLLSKIDGKYNTVEELIIDMHNSNVKRNDMSIYQILAFEMYARKKLESYGATPALVDVFSTTEKRGVYHYSNLDNTHHQIAITGDGNRVVSVFDIIRVLEHEMAHAFQEVNRKEMNIMYDEDVDLYSKDTFIRNIAFGWGDSQEYYDFNYIRFSDEYVAEVIARVETEKLLNGKRECFQKYKDKSDVIGDIEYKRNPERFFWGVYHLNDFFEDNFDYEIKRRGKEALEERMKKETPILLIEYDINKEEMPRRRSIEELLEMMNTSDDKKIKQVCLGLLINRFNEFKEKKEDVEESIKHVESLLKDNKIDKGIASILLHSHRKPIEENKNSR